MSICEIGEHKKIKGKWYLRVAYVKCFSCAFGGVNCLSSEYPAFDNLCIEHQAGWVEDTHYVEPVATNNTIDLKPLVEVCHGAAKAGGWWNDIHTGKPLQRNVGELLCLIHSEISEAMEAHRKNLMDDKLPHRKGIEVELADAVIRIADLCGGLGLDLSGAVSEKLAYNAKRADHKPENRKLEGGKAY